MSDSWDISRFSDAHMRLSHSKGEPKAEPRKKSDVR